MSFRLRLVSGTKDVLKLSFGKHLIVMSILLYSILMELRLNIFEIGDKHFNMWGSYGYWRLVTTTD